jgi:hypothetical protein
MRVVIGQPAAMTHADQGAFGQPRADQGVERVLESGVDGRGRLVEQDQAGAVDQDASDPQALLLTGGQDARPINLVVDPIRQVA